MAIETRNRRMTDFQQNRLEEMRDEIEKLSPEFRIIARYIDAHAEAQAAQNDELLKVFQAGKGVLSALKWLAGIGGALAMVWGALHGKIPQ